MFAYIFSFTLVKFQVANASSSLIHAILWKISQLYLNLSGSIISLLLSDKDDGGDEFFLESGWQGKVCWSLCLTKADVRSSYQCRAQMHCEQELKLTSVSIEWRNEVAIVAIRYITHYLLSCTSFEKRSCWIYSLLVYNVHFRNLSNYPKIRLSPSTFLYGFQAILLLSSVLFFLAKISAAIFGKLSTYKKKKMFMAITL